MDKKLQKTFYRNSSQTRLINTVLFDSCITSLLLNRHKKSYTMFLKKHSKTRCRFQRHHDQHAFSKSKRRKQVKNMVISITMNMKTLILSIIKLLIITFHPNFSEVKIQLKNWFVFARFVKRERERERESTEHGSDRIRKEYVQSAHAIHWYAILSFYYTLGNTCISIFWFLSKNGDFLNSSTCLFTTQSLLTLSCKTQLFEIVSWN